MAAVENVLKVLESLSPEDRRWMIANLPETAKAKLLSLSTADIQPTARIPEPIQRKAISESDDPILSHSPVSVARVLSSEPAWIIEVIVRDANADWRKQFLYALPSSSRSAVLALVHRSSPVSDPVLNTLRESTLTRLAALAPHELADQAQPSWTKWLATFPLIKRLRT